MKKVLITILFMLAAIGAYGQNTFKYQVRALGGLSVGNTADTVRIDSVILSGSFLKFYRGSSEVFAIDTTSLSDRIDTKLTAGLIDSIGTVAIDGQYPIYVGADTVAWYIPVDERQELSDVVVMLADTVNGSSSNDYIYTKYQIDTMTFAVDEGAVAAQINDTITARLLVAIPGVKLADSSSVAEPNSYATGNMLEDGLALKLTKTDTTAMLAPYFTEPEIRKADSDTIPLFIFGGGGGQAGDTAVFSTSSIYGSFYNEGSDTLVITSLRVIMLGDATDTLSVDILWDVNLDDGSPTELNTNPFPVNSFTTGDEDTSFNGNNIPPGYWVWCETPGVVTGRKPRYFIAQISGFKRNRSY